MNDQMPALFMTSMPRTGPTDELQAIAALIDEEHNDSVEPQCRKRKTFSIGSVQVQLTLSNFENTDTEPNEERPRKKKIDSHRSLKEDLHARQPSYRGVDHKIESKAAVSAESATVSVDEGNTDCCTTEPSEAPYSNSFKCSV